MGKKETGEYNMKMKILVMTIQANFIAVKFNGWKKLVIKIPDESKPYPYLHIEDCFTGYFY